MASPIENAWALAIPLAAKCGAALVADPYRLLALATAAFVIWLASLVLHWASPGGSAWGRYWWSIRGRRSCGAAIPGPRGLPLLGSLNLMTGLAHRKLAAVAAASGAERLMAFSLGDTRAIVTCDPDVAREILCSADFADRPGKESAYELMFDRSIGFAPYGAYWRALRRIATNHLFCPRQIAAFTQQRAEIAAQMVRAFASDVGVYRVVRPRDVLKRASLNNIMWSVFGRQYVLGEEGEEMRELRSLVEEGYDLLGITNWSDHLPFLAGLDLQWIRSSCSRIVPRVNRFVQRIIDEHRACPTERESDGAAGPDFVDVLLSLQGNDRLSDPDIVAVLWEMIFRGTDTVAVLIEWVLARLVLHGDVQAKVHEELDAVVGRHRAVTESDTSSLIYLQAVIKETLRVHPPGPLLSWARMSVSDVCVDGKVVPAGTTAMVNMWAITHNPAIWPDPLEFKPDRFLGPDAAELVILGSDLRLAPFGSGRRSCPGKSLAMATVTLWVASLLHEFEWRAMSEGGALDLSEELRLSCQMAAPLAVKLRRRE